MSACADCPHLPGRRIPPGSTARTVCCCDEKKTVADPAAEKAALEAMYREKDKQAISRGATNRHARRRAEKLLKRRGKP